MKEILQSLFGDLFLELLVIVLGTVVASLCVYIGNLRKKFNVELEKKVRDLVPDKYEDLVLDSIHKVLGALTGSVDEERPLKLDEGIKKLKDGLVEQSKEQIKEVVEKQVKEKSINLLNDFVNVAEKKIHSVGVPTMNGIDTSMASNIQVTQALRQSLTETTSKLQNDNKAVIQGFAEAQFNKEGFNQSVVGLSATVGIK